MIKFYHTSDYHFGVENYGKIDAKTGIHTRLLDFKESLQSCISSAIEENIDFFLFCGDAYKTSTPTPTQQKILTTLFFELYKAKIPVVIIVGNHDNPLSFGKANSLDIFGHLPLDGFYVFCKPDLMQLQTKSGLVNIVGIPWPTRHHLITNDTHKAKTTSELSTYIAERIGVIIKAFVEQADTKLPTILAGHLSVASGTFSGSEKPSIYGNDPSILPSQIGLTGFDYVALGHLHKYQNLNCLNSPPIVYSGSIEHIDFGEKNDQKGFCRVTIKTDESRKNRCSYEFIPLKTRPILDIKVNLETTDDYTEQIIKNVISNDISNCILKITYSVPDNISHHKIDFEKINNACKDAHYIVGCFPIYKEKPKEKRQSLK